MERVAFLVERTGDRVSCLLNPASIVMKRQAGVRSRASSQGPLTGAALGHDPLLYTGGGSTEILLDLLFDVSLVAAPDPVENVRDLTRPLTVLAEGSVDGSGAAQVPLVRFIWGKAWNILGVIAATSERLENFTPSGAPQRSWLRLRMIQVAEDEPSSVDGDGLSEFSGFGDFPDLDDISPEDVNPHQVQGTGDDPDEGQSSERLDAIASDRYGNPGWWRAIASFNQIDDPWNLPPGQVLMIPPVSSATERNV